MAVSGLGTRLIQSTAATDTVAGPLIIQGIDWIGPIVDADALVLTVDGDVVHRDTANPGHLGGFHPFEEPLRIKSGETLTVTTMTHGALQLHLL